MDRHSGIVEIGAQQRVHAHVLGHLIDASQQRDVIERGLDGRDPVAWKLLCLADQPRGLGERAHRDGPIVRGHTPELIAGDESRAGSEPSRPKRSDDTGRSGPDD